MLAKALAPEDVRDVYLDHREFGQYQRIQNSDGCMGERGGVDDDPVGCLARGVDPVDDLRLAVGLAEIERGTHRFRVRVAVRADVIQTGVPVNFRLADSEHVQVRTVYDENARNGR